MSYEVQRFVHIKIYRKVPKMDIPGLLDLFLRLVSGKKLLSIRNELAEEGLNA